MLLRYGLDHDWPGIALRVLADVYIGAWQLGIGLCFGIAILLFPTGRLPSPRWRIVLALTIVTGVYQLGTGMVSSARVFDDPRAVPILSVGLDVQGTTYNAVMGWLGALLELAQLASLVVRYRSGTEKVKRQILWLLLALIVFLLFNAQRFILGEGAILLLLSAVVIPIAIGVAIIRYELFDIRLVLSRTAVYTATVAVILSAYAALVATLSLVISEQSRRGVPVSAALIVAFAFNPVRLRVQSLVDRAFYGGRADPAGTARHVAAGLQRELHDGLGPTLTSIAFRVDAAANTVRADADTAGQLMREIGTDIRDAIDGVRRIVYGLRPIELDDLGLVGAIRQHVAAEPTLDNGNKVAIDLRAPETMPDLSPAVELAAYRIVMESITNVLRHSTARTCTITVAADGRLDLTIADDGTPPPTCRPGIGIRSLRDRAEELGGAACAGPADGGWTVHARLPLDTVRGRRA